MTPIQGQLALKEPSCSLVALDELEKKAREYARASRAPSTISAYKSDFADFRRWCDDHQLTSLPAAPRTIALYLTARSETLKVTSLSRRLSAIKHVHSRAGQKIDLQDPMVASTMEGLRREKGVRPRQAQPLFLHHIDLILRKLPDDLHGIRSAALLLTGWTGALRRSEIVGLDVEDLDWRDDGIVVTIQRSKTDQAGQGRTVVLPIAHHPARCPCKLLERWLDVAWISEGPLFRPVSNDGRRVLDRRLGIKQVTATVHAACKSIGLDHKPYSSHSLRSGFASQSARLGASAAMIAQQTGHASYDQVMRYIRGADPARDNAVSLLGL